MRLRQLVFTALLCGGCHPVRDLAVYRTEVAVTRAMVAAAAPAVLAQLQGSCRCVAGRWEPASGAVPCARLADWWWVYVYRWAWHVQMMLYNAGAASTDPGAAPALPPSECTLPEVP